MALNFMGLGFSFGAEDKGLSKTIEDVTDGFDDLADSTDNVGKATSTFVDKFNAFANMASSVQLGQLSDTVDSIANKMAGGESEIQDVSAAVETFRTQLTRDYPNVSQEELDKIILSQAQYGVGVSDTLKRLKSLQDAGTPFSERSGQMQIAGKASQAFGDEVDDLIGTFGALKSGFSFTTADAEDMLNAQVSIGQQFGMSGESVGLFTGSIEKMNSMLSLTEGLQTPEYMKQLGIQSSAMAGIIHKQLGTSSVKSAEQANEAMMKLLEITTQVNKIDVQKIAGEEYSELHKQLASFGGDFERIGKVAEEGPIAFMRYMNEMGESLPADRFAKFQTLIKDQFGDDFVYLMQTGFTDATEEGLKSMDKFQEGISSGSMGAGDKLGEFAEQSANTIEGLDKILDSTRENTSKMFGDIALDSRKTLRKGLISSAQAVQDKFAEWSKDKGMLGTLTRKFAIFNNIIIIFRK